MTTATILLLGDRDMAKPSHVAIEASLARHRQDHDAALTFRWVPTASLSAANVAPVLGDGTGVWCTPGSPYENTAGALAGIRFAREQGRAFLGTCGGFQHALMEFAASVLEQPAVHEELAPGAREPLIARLSCSLAGVRARVLAPPGSWYAATVGATDSLEEFNCNYGLSPAFEPRFADTELKFVARDEAGQVRAFRLGDHPFFVGTLFQPERRIFAGTVHPIVRKFLDAAGCRGGCGG